MIAPTNEEATHEARYLVYAIAAVVGVPAAVAAAATGQSPTAGHASTIELIERKASFKLVDHAPKGESPGDLGVLSGDLLAPGSGKREGRFEGVCVVVHPAAGNTQCTFTLSLAGGQFTTQAGYGEGFNGDKVVHEAVVGGTRSFSDARGEVVSEETGQTTGRLTIRLAG